MKAQAVFLNPQCADLLEDFLEPFEAVFSLREKVRISGWSMGLFCPKLAEETKVSLSDDWLMRYKTRSSAYLVRRRLKSSFLAMLD
jgi:hypothetical protein